MESRKFQAKYQTKHSKIKLFNELLHEQQDEAQFEEESRIGNTISLHNFYFLVIWKLRFCRTNSSLLLPA